MAKIVLVCLRNPASEPPIEMRRRMHAFLASLCPDNLKPAPPAIATDLKGLWVGVFNPAEEQAVHECSAYAGWLAQPKSRWWTIGEPTPDGSHAVFRGGRSAVEILADFAGSRSIWTAMTDRVFIASTTQRAIPYFLGKFEPNHEAQAWMLSSGTLGPRSGWDRRASRLSPGGIARLDRARWRLATSEPRLEYDSGDAGSDLVLADRLDAALSTAVGGLKLDFSRWVLPLSGGHDSRAILLLMKQRQKVRTVTWGSAESRDRRGNDAQIAPRVAAALGCSNEYFETDLAPDSIEKTLRRFVVAGDGCTDGFNAYLDGFRIWRHLFESGARGVIRGDQCFGLTPGPALRTGPEVRACIGLTPWSELRAAPSLAGLGLAHLEGQFIPPQYSRRNGEPHATWRDRLYQQFRLHVYMAGQHDLKSSYVEIANPLLTKELLEIARVQPQRLRDGKQLFLQVMARHDVGVDYAIESALLSPTDVTQMPKVRQWLHDQLVSRSVRRAFTGKFADSLAVSLSDSDKRSSVAKMGKRVRQHARMLLPDQVRSWVPREPRRASFDPRTVAMRAWLAASMLDRMAADARRGARAHLESIPASVSIAG